MGRFNSSIHLVFSFLRRSRFFPRSAFTLVELLVVISVIGILSTVLIAKIDPLSQINKARDAQRQQDLQSIKLSLDTYLNDKKCYPLSLNELSAGDKPYIKTMPMDPSTGEAYTYVTEGECPQWYSLFAKLRSNQPVSSAGKNCSLTAVCGSAIDKTWSCKTAGTVNCSLLASITTTGGVVLPTATAIPPTSTPVAGATETPTLTPTPSAEVLTTLASVLPSARDNLSCTESSLTNKIYCFGGRDASLNALNQIVEFDPSTNAVRIMTAQLPSSASIPGGGRYGLSCAESFWTRRIYCFGGARSILETKSDIVEYDLQLDQIRNVTNFPSGGLGYLDCKESSVTQKTYCFGGYDTRPNPQYIQQYDSSSNTIAARASLPGNFAQLSCAEDSAAGNMYCFGGGVYATGSSPSPSTRIIKYDPLLNVVTEQSATLPSGRRSLSCVESKDSHNIYCFGGSSAGVFEGTTGEQYFNTIIEYSPAANIVTAKSVTLPRGTAALSCAWSSVTHKIYCFGGIDQASSGQNWIPVNTIVAYTPPAGSSTTPDSTKLFVAYDTGGTSLKFARSNNNGTTWEKFTVDSVGSYPTLFAPDSNTMFIAYKEYYTSPWGLKFAKSVDSGLTWTKTRIDPASGTGYYPSLYSPDGNTIFVSYLDGSLKVAKSTDAGASWIIITVATGRISGSEGQNTSLYAPDANTVFVAYMDISVLKFAKSTDGGSTWTISDLGLGINPSIKVVGQTVFVSYSSGGVLKLAKSTNGGLSWNTTTVDSTTISGDSSIYAVDENILFITYHDESSNGYIKIARSTDGGGAWTTGIIDIGEVNSLQAIGRNVYVTYSRWGGPLRLAKSTDGGVTWVKSSIDQANPYAIGIRAIASSSAVIISPTINPDQCFIGYEDKDNDGYTTGGSRSFCGVVTLPSTYKKTKSTHEDCYDTNAKAFPGQTKFFGEHRGDGSFDYNCDGVQEVKKPCSAASIAVNPNPQQAGQPGNYMTWCAGNVERDDAISLCQTTDVDSDTHAASFLYPVDSGYSGQAPWGYWIAGVWNFSGSGGNYLLPGASEGFCYCPSGSPNCMKSETVQGGYCWCKESPCIFDSSNCYQATISRGGSASPVTASSNYGFVTSGRRAFLAIYGQSACSPSMSIQVPGHAPYYFELKEKSVRSGSLCHSYVSTIGR